MRCYRIFLSLFLVVGFALPQVEADAQALSTREFLVSGEWTGADNGYWILALDPPGTGTIVCIQGLPSGSSTQEWAEHIASTIDGWTGYTAAALYAMPGYGYRIQVSRDDGTTFFLWVGPGANCPNPQPTDLSLVGVATPEETVAGVTIIELGPSLVVVPALPSWALVLMGILLVAAVAWVLSRRRAAPI